MIPIQTQYAGERGSVCVVVVTYGDRFKYLAEVVGAALSEGADHIVVVDNGSDLDSQMGLDRLRQACSAISVHRYPTNQGSAIGFKTGMKLALLTACNFIWILDDDNRPEPGALSTLKRYWTQVSRTDKRTKTALSSFRKDRPNFVAALTYGEPDLVLPPKNSFMGFHVRQLVQHFLTRIKGPPNRGREIPDSGAIAAAAYGGLFVHRELIEDRGLPDEKYILYMDDFDYTIQLTRGGGEIWLLRNSQITDIEASYYLPAKKSLLYHSVFDSGRDASVYYSVRNSVYFAKKYLVKNKYIFYINAIAFTFIIFLIGILRMKFGRISTVASALFDGQRGILGVNPYFEL